MRENIVVLSQEEQAKCKHQYKSLGDKDTFSWTLLKETLKCIKCGHETVSKSPF